VLIAVLRARGLCLLGGFGVRLLLVGLLMSNEGRRLFGEAGLSGQQRGKGQDSGSEKVLHWGDPLGILRGFEVILVRHRGAKKRVPGE
jgi:hypothetical protein